jgi:hypothetical protein
MRLAELNFQHKIKNMKGYEDKDFDNYKIQNVKVNGIDKMITISLDKKE